MTREFVRTAVALDASRSQAFWRPSSRLLAAVPGRRSAKTPGKTWNRGEAVQTSLHWLTDSSSLVTPMSKLNS